MKILVVDDHAVVRRGVKQLLEEHFTDAVVAEAADGASALARVQEQAWDAVILDITLGEQNGLDVLGQLKRLRPETPALILSVHPEEQFAVTALRLGAAGYLTKDSAPEELVLAIERACSGGKYVSRHLGERLASLLDATPKRDGMEALSKRELEVLCGLGAGRTVSQVGDLLALSVKTVSTYRTRLLRKLRLASNAELVLYAVKNGLVR